MNTMYSHTRHLTLIGMVAAVFFGVIALFASPALALTISPNPPTASTTNTSATVTWQTDEAADAQVAYGTTTSYGNWSILDSSLDTNQSITIGGLTPNTLYYFVAYSENATGTTATSTQGTFTTQSTGTGTTTGTTSAPVISSVSAAASSTSATITWTTNQPADSMVHYGQTTAYGASTTRDTSLVTNHSVTVWGLTPNTLYHYIVMSANATGTTATSSDMTFTTLTGTGTGTTTGTTTQELQQQINTLWGRVIALEQQIGYLWNAIQDLRDNGNGNGGGNNGNGNGNGNGTTTPSGPAYIDQDGRTIEPGTQVDFGGHNFGYEEDITITLNGSELSHTPHADSEGNFSTGSMQTPTTPGTYVYTFTGQESGRSANATITVVSSS